MKKLTTIAIYAILLMSCTHAPVVVYTGMCVGDQQMYKYSTGDGIDWAEFYAPCNSYHIGDTIYPTQKLLK